MTRATLVSLVMLGPTAPSLDSLPRLFEEGPFLSEEEIARHHGG